MHIIPLRHPAQPRSSCLVSSHGPTADSVHAAGCHEMYSEGYLETPQRHARPTFFPSTRILVLEPLLILKPHWPESSGRVSRFPSPFSAVPLSPSGLVPWPLVPGLFSLASVPQLSPSL